MSELIITSDLMLFKGNVVGHHHHQRKKILCKESYHRGEERARKESLKSKQQIRQSYKSPNVSSIHTSLSPLLWYLLSHYIFCSNILTALIISHFFLAAHTQPGADLPVWNRQQKPLEPREVEEQTNSGHRCECSSSSRTLFSHSRSLTCSQQTEPPPHFVLSFSLPRWLYSGREREREYPKENPTAPREKVATCQRGRFYFYFSLPSLPSPFPTPQSAVAVSVSQKCSKRGLAELFQRAIPLLLLLLSYLLLLISHQANTYATNTQTLSLSLSTDQDDDEQNFPAI